MKLIERVKAFVKSETFGKFVRFAITGAVNTLIDIGVAALVRYLFHNDYLAQAAGYICGIINSYAVNRSWTFRKERDGFFSAQLVKFLAVNLLTLGISMGATWLFHTRLGVEPWIIMKLLVTAVTIVVNFTLSNLWAFRKKADNQPAINLNHEDDD